MDKSLQKTAIERFRTLAGLPEDQATNLVEAVLDASKDQAIETIAGSGPIPSNVTALRAELVRFVCLQANRILEQREVEVLFRVTPATARSILTTMRATYEESLREQFLARMRRDAVVRPAGTADAGLRWRVVFTELATYEIARAELLRLGNPDLIIDESSTRHSIEVAREAPAGGTQALDVLGIKVPTDA